ncbi:MAG: DNA mismatch repair protein MutL, partial [Oscillibacter sp.]|nr:DNA mismatch repair protein MutL [Oscillibacter sp.]
KFPGCVLHLEMKLNAVDVNVHPATTEVKFGSERRVFDAVYHAVLSALMRDNTRPAVTVDRPKAHDTVTPNQTTFKTMTAEQFRSSGLTLNDSAKNKTSSTWAEAAKVSTQKAVPVEKKSAFSYTAPGFVPKKSVTTNLFPKDIPAPKPVAPAAAPVAEPPKVETPAPAPVLEEKVSTKPEPVVEKIPEEAPVVEVPSPVEPPVVEVPAVQAEPELPVEPEIAPWRIAGEVLNTYIIVEQGDTVLFIDKHAAHERMNFDRMKAQGYQPMVQTLLTPVTFRPAAEELEVLLGNLPLLEEFGFGAEDFGGGALIVRQAPFDVDVGDIEATLLEIANKLLTTGRADPNAARDELLHTMACKAAIKGGWKTSPQELEKVAQAVMHGEVKYCPHGRPVAIELTKKQLEKQFKRA